MLASQDLVDCFVYCRRPMKGDDKFPAPEDTCAYIYEEQLAPLIAFVF